MPRCCIKCEKELIIGKTYTYTDDPEIYEQIQNRRLRQYQLENEYLAFLESQK